MSWIDVASPDIVAFSHSGAIAAQVVLLPALSLDPSNPVSLVTFASGTHLSILDSPKALLVAAVPTTIYHKMKLIK